MSVRQAALDGLDQGIRAREQRRSQRPAGRTNTVEIEGLTQRVERLGALANRLMDVAEHREFVRKLEEAKREIALAKAPREVRHRLREALKEADALRRQVRADRAGRTGNLLAAEIDL